MSKRFFLMMVLITLIFSLVMFLFPQIDLAISRYFYRPPQGFLLEINYYRFHINLFRDVLVGSTYIFIITLCLIIILNIFHKPLPIASKTCCFLLLCFLIAPGILVNHTLKNHWGRPRPHQIQEFGGDKVFQPAWVISKQCNKNCSFTSGETANVFCYLALLFVATRKKLIAGIVLFIGSLAILERIAQGGHFLSDVILSGLLDYLLIWTIYQVFFLIPPFEKGRPGGILYKNPP